MDDPREYCLSCSRPYTPTDEVCPRCGFDPVSDKDDEREYEEACAEYDKWCEYELAHGRLPK